MKAMSENRWRSATVAGLCTETNLNKRYFYESFVDLDTLAVAVIDDISSTVAAAALTALTTVADDSLEAQARQSVDAVVEVFETDRRKARVLLGGAAGTPAVDERRTQAIAGLTALLIEFARSVHDVRLEVDSFASTAPAFLIGGTAQTILAWSEGTLPVTRTQLVSDISDLYLALGDSAARIARERLLNTISDSQQE